MDIHKPKAAHSWREFGIEIGTIICGILIALGLEQGIEWLHWRHAGERAIEALTDDGRHLFGSLRERADQQACIDRRLVEIKTILARHDAGTPLAINGQVGRPFYIFADAPSWDVAVADGSLAHLPYSDRSRFALAFSAYKLYERQAFEEKSIWQRLQLLNHHPVLTDADWSQVRRDHDLATDYNESFRITIPGYMKRFNRFPKPPDRSPITAPVLVALCTTMFEPPTPH